MERRPRVERVEVLRRHFEPPTVPGRSLTAYGRKPAPGESAEPWRTARGRTSARGSAAWHVLKPRGTVVNVSKPPTEPHDAPDTPSLSDGATADAGRDRQGGGREAVSVADAA